MNGMTQSATVQRINAQVSHMRLEDSIALLKRANRYVGTHSSIGGQVLGVQITEFIAAYERDKHQEQTA